MIETLLMLAGSLAMFPQVPFVAVLGGILYVAWSFSWILQTALSLFLLVTLIYGTLLAMKERTPATYADMVTKYAPLREIDSRLIGLVDYSFADGVTWALGLERPGDAPVPASGQAEGYWRLRTAMDITLALTGVSALMALIPIRSQ